MGFRVRFRFRFRFRFRVRFCVRVPWICGGGGGRLLAAVRGGVAAARGGLMRRRWGVGSVKALEDLAGLVDGPARLRPRIADEAALGDEAAVRALFARLRSRRVVGKCVIRADAAAADPVPDATAAAVAAAAVAAASAAPTAVM